MAIRDKESQLRSAEIVGERGKRGRKTTGRSFKLIMMVKKKMEKWRFYSKIADDLLEDIDVIEKI